MTASTAPALPLQTPRPRRNSSRPSSWPPRERSITRRTLVQIPRSRGDRLGALVRIAHAMDDVDEETSLALRRAILRSARFHEAELRAFTLVPDELRVVVEGPSWALDGLILEVGVHLFAASLVHGALGRPEARAEPAEPSPPARVDILRDADAWHDALVRATIGA